MRVGILALQGAVEPHRAKLAALGVEAVAVRLAEELAGCAGLILPGGESTTMLNLIEAYGLEEPLREFAARRPCWGVCAGSILMAAEVENPSQVSFGLMPITVRRNAYGRQNESFIAKIDLRLPGEPPRSQEAVFIRAPRITRCAPETRVLAELDGAPVAVEHGRHLATTFHPELSEGDRLHRHFLTICGAQRLAGAG
ncbi:MAG: pyridoxal 5'-phosphate synthase glutaminase subunit PdxT [Candidatus Lambdaproteobacteria bacterium]|nr:pyridoxal 5'-phosphate synthase glutaminase subunit PdxT [Candidatus Lambdaproteobacteria bacterium]